MNIDFSGKTAIVTGAAHGFGRAIAVAFAERGATVWACDLVESEILETQAMLRNMGNASHMGRIVDVGKPDQVRAFVSACMVATSRVDVLVNNAGGVLGQVHQPLEDVTQAQWQAIYDVNVHGAFYFSQAVAPAMKAAKYGRIVNISSGAGLTISLTGIQAYASAKAAQISLTRQLAHELGSWNITVNNIAPGFVRSNPSTEKQWDGYGQKGQQALIENIALKRLGTAEDIAHGVLFFASDYAGWITGQVLSVDGGK